MLTGTKTAAAFFLIAISATPAWTQRAPSLTLDVPCVPTTDDLGCSLRLMLSTVQSSR